MFEWFNPPAIVYIYQRKNSNEVGEQLVTWRAGHVWRYKHCVDDVTVLIVSAEYNAQTTHSCLSAMLMARVNPIVINYAMFLNPFATNAVTTAQIQSWWSEDIARIDPAQRNSHPPRAYISVVNESSQWLLPSLTLCIRLAQRLLAPVLQRYTAAWPQSTLFTDFEHSSVQRSGNFEPGYWPRTCLHAPQTLMR